MWYERDLGKKISALAGHFPALLVTGARQTGKTSLLQRLFPERSLVTLDLPSLAEEAERRPADFLAKFPPPVTVDEVQYAPGLFRHLKRVIDAARSTNGQFILSGSQKSHLMHSVSDSLAGRCGLVELRSLSAREFARGGAFAPRDRLGFLLRGGFPQLCTDPGLSAAEFFRAYMATYLERDVRNLLRVGSLRDFERFVRMAASRSAGLLNLAELARDVGIAQSTAGQWLSVLQASGLVVLLEPYFNNYGTRIVKTPKLYFTDTGLLCFLLGISSVEALVESPSVGQLWETFVLGQILRHIEREATAATVWFWRDAHGAELDFLVDSGMRFTAVECKWTEHPVERDLASMAKVLPLLRADRPVTARVICRTPHAFGLPGDVEAVNGFETMEWFSSP